MGPPPCTPHRRPAPAGRLSSAIYSRMDSTVVALVALGICLFLLAGILFGGRYLDS